ncbi:MAG: stage II sporulation protein P [Lachnospiraceae bacterium]|nr:stage II sporulation protein P [Lachnospiraceae bacterium]
MRSTKPDGWLQKLMYVLITVLSIYILYKGTGLLAKNDIFRQSVESSALPKNAEDTAVRTYAPGYAAAVEGKKSRGWLADLLEPLVPVYSYMAGMDTEEELEANAGETKNTAEKGQASGQQEEQSQTEKRSASENTDENREPQNPEDTETSEMKTSVFEEKTDDLETERNVSEEKADSSETEKNVAEEKAGVSETEKNASEESSAMENTTSESDEDLPLYEKDPETGEAEEALEAAGMGKGTGGRSLLTEQLKDFNYLITNYYTLDSGTSIDHSLLNAEKLLTEDLSIQKNPEVPQILIYHTHSQEAFADSREGETSDSIVGMGEVLAELLRTKYGYQVIHDTGVYDLVNGVLDRSAAYDYARESVQKKLEEHPDIEVVIDLHRDGVDGQKFVTEINGKPCSMIMFFNGLSRDEEGNPLTWLDNPYVADNLAFSLQLQLKARQQYSGYTRNIYLKAERFNLHLRPRSLLIEAGTQLNTVEEEKNAMEPLADLLDQVLSGK